MTDPLRAEREAALAQIEVLTREFDEVVAASQASNADDEHDPEGATIAFERQQVVALLEQAQRRLADVDAALARRRGRRLRALRDLRPADRRRAARRPPRGAHLHRLRALSRSPDRLEQARAGRAGERGRGLPRRPHGALQESQEALRLLAGREVEVDDDVAVVVDRLRDAFGGDAGLAARIGEPVVGGPPGGEVGDRVLDVQGGHRVLRARSGATVGTLPAADIPTIWGFSRPCAGDPAGRGGSVSDRVALERICAADDDARTLRLRLLAELRRTVGFDAYAWVLTDPETTGRVARRWPTSPALAGAAPADPAALPDGGQPVDDAAPTRRALLAAATGGDAGPQPALAGAAVRLRRRRRRLGRLP